MDQPVAEVNLMQRLDVMTIDKPKREINWNKTSRKLVKSVKLVVTSVILMHKKKQNMGPTVISMQTKKSKKYGSGHPTNSGRDDNANRW